MTPGTVSCTHSTLQSKNTGNMKTKTEVSGFGNKNGLWWIYMSWKHLECVSGQKTLTVAIFQPPLGETSFTTVGITTIVHCWSFGTTWSPLLSIAVRSAGANSSSDWELHCQLVWQANRCPIVTESQNRSCSGAKAEGWAVYLSFWDALGCRGYSIDPEEAQESIIICLGRTIVLKLIF